VLRRALAGQCASGTVVLDPDRLVLEGGTALRDRLAVRLEDAVGAPVASSALFWWVACPVHDDAGRVAALLYGGTPLNRNFGLVDDVREMLFGTQSWGGKPRGTVTIFLGSVRVATNVQAASGRRAVGTRVSPAVEREVLERGGTWRDRAWVVDAWYLSAYEPIRDPDGRIVGMLYLGLLEAPYASLRTGLLLDFLAPVLLVGLLAVIAATYIGGRIARPIRRLGRAAGRMAQGDWDQEAVVRRTWAEINGLADAFRKMQSAIADRDRQLRERNRVLAQTNEELERLNRNYMQMVGFITHELKSPLVAIQGMIFGLVNDPGLALPERCHHMLGRVQRACEDLQDMVKNYLDLSRAERGELVAATAPVDLGRDVVEPSALQTEELFSSRRMKLAVDAPAGVAAVADAELLRIAVINLLSNAAKYGREGGEARIRLHRQGDEALIDVWNEGPGFTAAERERLFGKFARLKNPNTRDKRGSGLGLFLCRHVAEQHGGRVSAESEPGKWARFTLTLPLAGPARPS
jgi:signal transduction histidine kinase